MTTPANVRPAWKFEKTLNIGDLLSVVTGFVLLVLAYGALTEPIALVEQRVSTQTEINAKQDARIEALLESVDKKLTDINRTLYEQAREERRSLAREKH